MSHLSDHDIEKLSQKDSFLIQKNLHEDIKEMSRDEVYLLFLSIFGYVNDGELRDLSDSKLRFVRVAFNRFKNDYVDDSKKWIESCEKKSKRKKEDWEKRQPLKHPKYG